MNRSRRIRILYIDNDSSDRLLLKLALNVSWDHEYEVLEAEDGFLGLKRARHDLPDMILLDTLLPGMDGYEVIARLKGISSLRDVPVIAVTSESPAEARGRALAAGCAGYIQKPFNMKTLASELQEFLEGKSESLSPEDENRYLRELSRYFAERLENRFLELTYAQEEIRDAERLTSKFIALVSHELRTPVTIIQGYLGILLDAAREGRNINSPEAVSTTMGLDKGVQRLSGVINDILDAARIESGDLQLHLAEVSMNEIMRSVANDLRPALEQRQQKLVVEPFSGLPRLWIDSKRMYQVLMNVVGNAIKFTPDGGQISIKADLVSKESIHSQPGFTPLAAQYVKIVIEDTGIGIEEEDLDRIFRSFYEVRDGAFHSTGKYQFLGGGVGLGLSIARGIVKKHGGWLWAESPGCDLDGCPGSDFNILIPVRVSKSV